MLDPATVTMMLAVGIEWLLIAAIAVALFFGVKKIPELARSIGRASGEYEKARVEAKKELESLKGEGTSAKGKLEEIAKDLGIDYENKNTDELRADIRKEIEKE